MNDISLADQMFNISNAACEKKVNKYYKKYIKRIEKGIAKSSKKGIYYYSFLRDCIPQDFQEKVVQLLIEYFENQGFEIYIGHNGRLQIIQIKWNKKEV